MSQELIDQLRLRAAHHRSAGEQFDSKLFTAVSLIQPEKPDSQEIARSALSAQEGEGE